MAPSPSSTAAVLAVLVVAVVTLLGMGCPAAAATACSDCASQCNSTCSAANFAGAGRAAPTAASRRHARAASKRTNQSAGGPASVRVDAKQVVDMTVKALAKGLAATSPAGAASAPSRRRARPASKTTPVGAHPAAPLTASATASSYHFRHSTSLACK